MQAPKGFFKPQTDKVVILIFITVASPFTFHPGSVVHVSFFSHKCTRQLRQMPNNRRRFLPWHENAAVAWCTWGPQDQLNLLLAELENVRPPPSRPPLNCGFWKTRFVLLCFFRRIQLWMKFPVGRFDRLLMHGDIFVFQKSDVQAEAFRCALLRSLILQPYWNHCCTGRPCLLEGWKISIISK